MNFFKKIWVILMMGIFLLGVNFVLAQDFLGDGSFGNRSYYEAESLAMKAGYSPTSDDNAEGDLISFILNVVNIFLGLVGFVLVIMLLYAGFLYMTAGGEEKQVTTAKNWIRNGLIGLLVIFASYGFTFFVFRTLVESIIN